MSVMCHWRYGLMQGATEFNNVKVSPTCTVGEATALCKVGKGITSDVCGVWYRLLHHQNSHLSLLVRLVFILAMGDVLYH